jgi:protein-S-isoprenylcysteine O-methyltransferase Ste14
MSEVNLRDSSPIDRKSCIPLRGEPDKSGYPVPDNAGADVTHAADVEPAGESSLVSIGKFFFKYRNIISPLVFCALAIASKPLIIAGSRRFDLFLDIIGITVALAGQFLRIFVIGFAYIKRGGKDKEVYADTLVQEGFFAHCRNPLYDGNILTLLGLIIIHSGILMYAVCLPFYFFLYWTITLAEENYLREKFGDVYDAYTKKVPRFLISFKGITNTLKGMTYDWKKVIRKEYGTIFVSLTMIMALLVWERITADGFNATRRFLNFMLLLWVPTVLAYVAARIAKKSGVLGTG